MNVRMLHSNEAQNKLQNKNQNPIPCMCEYLSSQYLHGLFETKSNHYLQWNM